MKRLLRTKGFYTLLGFVVMISFSFILMKIGLLTLSVVEPETYNGSEIFMKYLKASFLVVSELVGVAAAILFGYFVYILSDRIGFYIRKFTK